MLSVGPSIHVHVCLSICLAWTCMCLSVHAYVWMYNNDFFKSGKWQKYVIWELATQVPNYAFQQAICQHSSMQEDVYCILSSHDVVSLLAMYCVCYMYIHLNDANHKGKRLLNLCWVGLSWFWAELSCTQPKDRFSYVKAHIIWFLNAVTKFENVVCVKCLLVFKGFNKSKQEQKSHTLC